MSETLDGIRLKIQRAWNRLDTLKTEITSFLNTRPYKPGVEFNPHAKTITVFANIVSDPPAMWGVQVGEIIHNLRSALDHTVYQLVVAKSGTRAVTTKTQFAIFETHAGFSGRGIKEQLKGMSDAAIDLIRSEQPFPQSDGGTGEGIANSPLWHLRELNNTGDLAIDYGHSPQATQSKCQSVPMSCKSARITPRYV